MEELVVLTYFTPILNKMMNGLSRMGYSRDMQEDVCFDVFPSQFEEEQWGIYYSQFPNCNDFY